MTDSSEDDSLLSESDYVVDRTGGISIPPSDPEESSSGDSLIFSDTDELMTTARTSATPRRGIKTTSNCKDETVSSMSEDDDDVIEHTTSDASNIHNATENIESDDSDSNSAQSVVSVRSGNSSMQVKDDADDALDHVIQEESDVEDYLSADDKVSVTKEESVWRSTKSDAIVDLTDSGDSLQNSPVGARMIERVPEQLNVSRIVAELSAVEADLRVQENILENVKHLPDNGKKMMEKIANLNKLKVSLKKQLSDCDDLREQKKGYQMFEGNHTKANIATKQTTLNFESYMKTEPLRDITFEASNISSTSKMPTGEDLPISVKSEEVSDYDSQIDDQSSTGIPAWGELPKPDMTISNFGKQAMETHLTEKALTFEALTTLHNALKTCPSEGTMAEDPRGLKVDLMPHQKHGLAWMLWRERQTPAGGILADDMGLGKTLSMIALILKSYEEENEDDDSENDSENDSDNWMSSKHSRMPKGGTLVVCPASLVAQWEREIYKRVKRKMLSVELYHGSNRETKARRLARHDVVLTTYQLMGRESGVDTAKNATSMKEKGPLHQIKWERIILDEAHIVRNHKSQISMGVCELVGKRRWCLTGTPIQNKELDLYALLKFLRCSPFDDLTVWKRWVDNRNVAGTTRLNTMMKSLMLRRTKEQLQERGDLNCLPDKNVEIIDVHLDPEEVELYEKVAVFSSTLFAQFLNQRAEKQQVLDARYGSCNLPTWQQGDRPDNNFFTTEELAQMHRKMQGLNNIKTHEILVLLLRLRQICCHPGLVKKMVESGDLDLDGGVEDADGLDTDLFNQMNNLNINEADFDKELVEEEKRNHAKVLSVDNPILSFDRPSAKIKAILNVLEEKIIGTEDKAIVVSQWTSVLNIMSGFLKDKNIHYSSLTGEIPVAKRQDIVNEFNRPSSGPQILLLSLTAGGVGLNLVGANHLLLIDLHWNPQLEAQASDRIYRVGQKKSVFVYKFITEDTIEARIKLLQDKKLALADSVLTGTKNTQASKLTLDDLKLLFAAPTMPSAPQA